MASVLFIILIVIVLLLLLVMSIAATVGAVAAGNSTLFSVDSRVRSAYQYLVISAAMGWGAFVMLLITIIVVAVAEGFATDLISACLLSKKYPNINDLTEAYRAEKELEYGRTTYMITLIVLIIVTIIALIVLIFTIYTAFQLGGVNNSDSNASLAFTMSITTALAAFVTLIFMIVLIFAYIGLNAAREIQLEQIKTFETRAEKELDITPKQLATRVQIMEEIR
jgi:hypothetical protein